MDGGCGVHPHMLVMFSPLGMAHEGVPRVQPGSMGGFKEWPHIPPSPPPPSPRSQTTPPSPSQSQWSVAIATVEGVISRVKSQVCPPWSQVPLTNIWLLHFSGWITVSCPNSQLTWQVQGRLLLVHPSQLGLRCEEQPIYPPLHLFPGHHPSP